jgi:hypothetical protein
VLHEFANDALMRFRVVRFQVFDKMMYRVPAKSLIFYVTSIDTQGAERDLASGA